VEVEEKKSRDAPEIPEEKNGQAHSDAPENGRSVLIDPDLDFIKFLFKQSKNPYKKCMQCGTCSATCEISQDLRPFPGKEMAWAAWGMKDRLLVDPDVWLCHQCNDCSTRCPRGARPGDLLASVRQEHVKQWAFPKFLGKWVNEPQSLLLLFGLPILLLSLALGVREPIEKALGIASTASSDIIFAYSSLLPHWMLISFFLFFTLLVVVLTSVSVKNFWRAMKEPYGIGKTFKPSRSIFQCLISTLKRVFLHEDFSNCTRTAPRFWSHICVLFGFIALSVVTFWIISARINPFIHTEFIYPFSFWSPWKVLANLGGLLLTAGCLLMIWNRFFYLDDTHPGTYFDWVFLSTLLLVVITGFGTEILHYIHLDPHRHLIYFVHLVFVLALLLYLPYSKFAHIVYRTTALVFVEYIGRNNGIGSSSESDDSKQVSET